MGRTAGILVDAQNPFLSTDTQMYLQNDFSLALNCIPSAGAFSLPDSLVTMIITPSHNYVCPCNIEHTLTFSQRLENI